jgi:hypothetical protein
MSPHGAEVVGEEVVEVVVLVVLVVLVVVDVEAPSQPAKHSDSVSYGPPIAV